MPALPWKIKLRTRSRINHLFKISRVFLAFFDIARLHLSNSQGCKSLLSIGGIIHNFSPILPHFQHWGDEPWPRSFSGEQIKWKPKKKDHHQKWNTFFPKFRWRPNKRSSPKFPRFEEETWAHMHTRVKLLGGDADEDHNQIIGGIYPPPSSPGFGTPANSNHNL